jgi:regulator of replication initiation timing
MGKLADAIRDGVSIPDQKRRQILRLDEEFSALESENKILKAENIRLQVEVNPLKKENQELKARIKQQDEASIDEVSEAMLLRIANGGQHRESLMQCLGLGKAKCDYHFSVLEKRKFSIETSYGVMSVIAATPEGLEYLAQKGKL